MATDICAQVGKKIRELRLEKGWRQIDLAQHLGIHEVHISDLERGSREAGIRTLEKLANALETDICSLLS